MSSTFELSLVDRKRGYCNFLLWLVDTLGICIISIFFTKFGKKEFCKFHLVDILRIFWKYLGNTPGKKGAGEMSKKVKHL